MFSRISHCAILPIFLVASATAQLAGSYSVNPARPTANRNFTSLQDAVSALAAQGISAPVSIELFDTSGPFQTPMPFTAANVTWGNNDAVLTLQTIPGASETRRVTFRSAPGHRAVLDASNTAMGIFWNGASFVTVEGLEIRNAEFDAISIYSETSHGAVQYAEILSCRLHSCGGAGIVLYGNLPAPRNTLIENNLLYDLQQTGSGGFANTGRFGYISTRRTMGTVIRHNTIVATTGSGPWFAVIGSNPGSLTDEPILQLTGNIISQLARTDRPIFFFPTISTVTSIPTISESNLVDSQSVGPFALIGSSGSTSVPDLAIWQGMTGLDNATLPVLPRFVDLPSRDFRLAPSSLAIDSAFNTTQLDIEGNYRDANPDMGAYEYRDPQTAGVRSFGSGQVGSHGGVLLLGTDGFPTLGNLRLNLRYVNAVPNGDAYLFASGSFNANPWRLADGSSFLLEESGLFALMSAGVVPMGPVPSTNLGQGRIAMPIFNLPQLSGLNLAFQLAVVDAANSVTGLQLSNAVQIEIR